MPSTPSVRLLDAEAAVIRALAYFSVFRYPLTGEEILHFCAEKECTQTELDEALEEMCRRGRIFRFGQLYQLSNDQRQAEKRLACNQRAAAMLPKARQMAHLIGRFPFVRGVFISGSMSKHCMQPDSDVDFFIVTEKNRLWIARTLLVLYKKIFLFNSHKYFCVNYFVDIEHLEIAEQNQFTATEIVTLLPFYGKACYTRFCQANAWAWAYYPHYPSKNAEEQSERGGLKNLLEWLFSGKPGAWLDALAMRFTVWFWRRKFRGMDADTFNLALKSSKGVSKHHPLHYQHKVLERFEAILAEQQQ